MSDDPTKQVPPTQPTLETVLERINAWGQKLSGEIQEVRAELAEFRTETQGRFQEIGSQIKQINRTFEVVANDLLEMKARTREAEARLDELERKAS